MLAGAPSQTDSLSKRSNPGSIPSQLVMRACSLLFPLLGRRLQLSCHVLQDCHRAVESHLQLISVRDALKSDTEQ
jgi:hypothetical protein